MDESNGLQRLDALINRLIDSDQTGEDVAPFDLARELGEIRAQLMAMPVVHRSTADQRHYRCEACGTIVHGDGVPGSCPRCGGTALVNVDIRPTGVDAG